MGHETDNTHKNLEGMDGYSKISSIVKKYVLPIIDIIKTSYETKIELLRKKFVSPIKDAIETRKTKKELLWKIGYQDINDDDKEFILSLPNDELKNLCKRITENAWRHCLDADSARRYPKELADTELERIIPVIERINSVLRFISDSRNIDVEYVRTDYLTNYLILNN